MSIGRPGAHGPVNCTLASARSGNPSDSASVSAATAGSTEEIGAPPSLSAETALVVEPLSTVDASAVSATVDEVVDEVEVDVDVVEVVAVVAGAIVVVVDVVVGFVFSSWNAW